MERNLQFTRHGLERYRERIEPMYGNLNPEVFVYGALTHGYNFYELDRECRRELAYVQKHSKEGNVFIVYRSFVFIFHYDYASNTYWLITVFDVPWKIRFLYNDYMR